MSLLKEAFNNWVEQKKAKCTELALKFNFLENNVSPQDIIREMVQEGISIKDLVDKIYSIKKQNFSSFTEGEIEYEFILKLFARIEKVEASSINLTFDNNSVLTISELLSFLKEKDNFSFQYLSDKIKEIFLINSDNKTEDIFNFLNNCISNQEPPNYSYSLSLAKGSLAEYNNIIKKREELNLAIIKQKEDANLIIVSEYAQELITATTQKTYLYRLKKIIQEGKVNIQQVIDQVSLVKAPNYFFLKFCGIIKKANIQEITPERNPQGIATKAKPKEAVKKIESKEVIKDLPPQEIKKALPDFDTFYDYQAMRNALIFLGKLHHNSPEAFESIKEAFREARLSNGIEMQMIKYINHYIRNINARKISGEHIEAGADSYASTKQWGFYVSSWENTKNKSCFPIVKDMINKNFFLKEFVAHLHLNQLIKDRNVDIKQIQKEFILKLLGDPAFIRTQTFNFDEKTSSRVHRLDSIQNSTLETQIFIFNNENLSRIKELLDNNAANRDYLINTMYQLYHGNFTVDMKNVWSTLYTYLINNGVNTLNTEYYIYLKEGAFKVEELNLCAQTLIKEPDNQLYLLKIEEIIANKNIRIDELIKCIDLSTNINNYFFLKLFNIIINANNSQIFEAIPDKYALKNANIFFNKIFNSNPKVFTLFHEDLLKQLASKTLSRDVIKELLVRITQANSQYEDVSMVRNYATQFEESISQESFIKVIFDAITKGFNLNNIISCQSSERVSQGQKNFSNPEHELLLKLFCNFNIVNNTEHIFDFYLNKGSLAKAHKFFDSLKVAPGYLKYFKELALKLKNDHQTDLLIKKLLVYIENDFELNHKDLTLEQPLLLSYPIKGAIESSADNLINQNTNKGFINKIEEIIGEGIKNNKSENFIDVVKNITSRYGETFFYLKLCCLMEYEEENNSFQALSTEASLANAQIFIKKIFNTQYAIFLNLYSQIMALNIGEQNRNFNDFKVYLQDIDKNSSNNSQSYYLSDDEYFTDNEADEMSVSPSSNNSGSNSNNSSNSSLMGVSLENLI